MNLFFVSQNEIWEAYKIWRFIMNIFADFPNKRQRIHNIKNVTGIVQNSTDIIYLGVPCE